MLHSVSGRRPGLVAQARQLNEFLPVHVAGQVVDLVGRLRGSAVGARLAVLGWAYKGWPPTDDMRGTPIAAMMPVFTEAGMTVVGHDPMVAPEVIAAYGGRPVELVEAFTGADAVLVITDHPEYRGLAVESLLAGPARPVLVFDSWRVLDEKAVTAAGVHYAGLGYRTRLDDAAGPLAEQPAAEQPAGARVEGGVA